MTPTFACESRAATSVEAQQVIEKQNKARRETRMKLRPLLFGLAAIALAAGCGAALPGPDDARVEFEERLQAQLGPKARVIDFKKLDGLKYEEGGAQAYDLEFAAKVEAPGAQFEEDIYVGTVTFIRAESGWRMQRLASQSRMVHEAESNRMRERVNASRLNQDLRVIEAGLSIYMLDNFAYPTEEQGLQALVQEPTAEPKPRNWKQGGYLRELPRDPWGNPYRYRNPGLHGAFDIFSLGADDAPGGDGEAADVGNWLIR
jgi:general secretion pathway protein G